jgi:serine/threonine-protein kinase
VDKTEGTGQRVGAYRVVRKLATGGTSDVLLAKAEGPHGFERSVVLKLLLPEYKHDAEFKGMFGREAAAYARLSHPSIVRLYDFFANDDQLVMVLEYIDGPPLSRLRGMLKAIGQHLDDTTALYIAAGVFDALAAAHGAVDDGGEPAPVIHRDVNPSNVLIPWDGQVKLADFGVAKVTGASHQSSVGLIRGTFGYMAPEQVNGDPVTPRADVYAGAIILWELLTKRRAFIRGALPEIEVLRELAEPRIVSIDVIRPDLDKSVRDAIKRALQPRGDKRTITAEEIASILRAVVPESEGREKLAKSLALVRHEPKPSATSIPPPVTMTFGGPDPARYEARVAIATKPGFAPRPTPPPLPAVKGGVSRQTAPYGATPAVAIASGASSPRPPVVAPPRPAAKAPDPPATEASPSSERGLAALLEPSESDPRPNVTGTSGSSTGPTSDRGMRDSIDDILRSMPSNVPPNLFPKTDPPGGIPSGAVGVVPPANADALGDPFARGIGDLPPAPPPLDPSLPLNLGATLVDEPPAAAKSTSSFPPLDRTLALERAPVQPPSRPAHLVTQAMIAPMPGVDPFASPPTARMAGFSDAAAPPTPAPPPPTPAMPPPHMPAPPSMRSSPPATQPLGMNASVAPAPLAAHYPSGPAPGSFPPAYGAAPTPSSVMPGASGPYPAGPAGSLPPAHHRKRRSSSLAVVGVLFVVLLAGAGGTAGYLRWQRSRLEAGSTTSTASSRVAATPDSPPQASATVVPAASIAPAASVALTASGPSPSLAASASPSGSTGPASGSAASASATSAPTTAGSASASAPAGDVPPGMGRVRTAGAVPGRRIFVDERVVGQTPDAVVVKCGVRSIKLGSSGVARPVDVPCGAEIPVSDR